MKEKQEIISCTFYPVSVCSSLMQNRLIEEEEEKEDEQVKK